MSMRIPFGFVVPPAEQICSVTPRVATARRKKTVRGPIPAELPIEKIVAVVDTREQLPHDLSPLAMEVDTLRAGDYSVRGLENVVAIERKSLPDFLACVGVERERFETCVQRLLAYPVRAIVIEASWGDLERGDWRSRVTPAAAINSVLGWIARGLSVILAGDRQRAAQYVSRLLVIAARQRWRESRELIVSADRIIN